MKKLKIFAIALWLLLPLFAVGQPHHIGDHKGDIISSYAYSPKVLSMSINAQIFDCVTMEVMKYRFRDKDYYYYINIENGVCESFAALYDSPTAKDSLIRVFDAKYERMPSGDTTSIAWKEHSDGIDYKRVVRDFNPPTCLVVLAIIQRVEDE